MKKRSFRELCQRWGNPCRHLGGKLSTSSHTSPSFSSLLHQGGSQTISRTSSLGLSLPRAVKVHSKSNRCLLNISVSTGLHFPSRLSQIAWNLFYSCAHRMMCECSCDCHPDICLDLPLDSWEEVIEGYFQQTLRMSEWAYSSRQRCQRPLGLLSVRQSSTN